MKPLFESLSESFDKKNKEINWVSIFWYSVCCICAVLVHSVGLSPYLMLYDVFCLAMVQHMVCGKIAAIGKPSLLY
jgi:hypothetical protein